MRKPRFKKRYRTTWGNTWYCCGGSPTVTYYNDYPITGPLDAGPDPDQGNLVVTLCLRCGASVTLYDIKRWRFERAEEQRELEAAARGPERRQPFTGLRPADLSPLDIGQYAGDFGPGLTLGMGRYPLRRELAFWFRVGDAPEAEVRVSLREIEESLASPDRLGPDIVRRGIEALWSRVEAL